MRVLRCTYFTAPNDPTVVVTLDSDVIDTLESIAITAVETMDSGFVTYDIFEMEDADIQAATMEAGRRTREVEQQERRQAFLYFWLVGTWTNGIEGRMPNPGATMAGDKPTPLSTEEIRSVFEQLAKHPLYNDFTLIYPDRDGNFVTLRHGRVE